MRQSQEVFTYRYIDIHDNGNWLGAVVYMSGSCKRSVNVRNRVFLLGSRIRLFIMVYTWMCSTQMAVVCIICPEIVIVNHSAQSHDVPL